MLVRVGDRTCLEARATAEPAADVLTRDFYTLRPQLRLTGDLAGRPQPAEATEVTLDGNDVTQLVDCALRHPNANMRHAVLTAIWNHPDSFRQIFRFGLTAPGELTEIRKIVAEELAKAASTPESPAANRGRPAAEALLPRMPVPAHLRGKSE
jgi:hypothetical protein